jgi:Mn-dependent DtxR family transcriptional regulator
MANVRVKSEKREVANYGLGKIERTSTTACVYVQDLAFWSQAQDRAEELGLSMSEMIMQALRSFMDPNECKRCDRIREILSVGSIVVKGKE